MPELPEVETLVRGLRPIVGKTIERVHVLDDRLSLDPRPLAGARVAGIRRCGKFIVIGLEERGDMVVHLRMSGRLRLQRSEEEAPYTRLIIDLTSGERVYFVNPRRLGTVAHEKAGFSASLGVEPTEGSFTVAQLKNLASRSRAPIKQLLMDQKKIAGLGNIYAAEALWRAGIDPRRPANALSEQELTSLRDGIVSVLHEAIGELGSTLGTRISDYRPGPDREGAFQNRLAVYGRSGEPCARCGVSIVRVVQAGRTTCFCPACQR